MCLGKIDLQANVLRFVVHIGVNICGQTLHSLVAALLAVKDVDQKLDGLVLEIVTDVVQRFVWAEESPRHERRNLLGNGVEMAHKSVGIAEHTAFGLQHGPHGRCECLTSEKNNIY